MAKQGDIIEISHFKGTREQLLRRYPKLVLRSQQRIEKDAGELDGLWICGRHLDEEFSIGETYETREDAIAGAPDEIGLPVGLGAVFATGRLSYVRQTPGLPTDPDRLLEDAGENLGGDWNEAAIENWTERAAAVMGDLEIQIEKAWDDWCARHDLDIAGYTCEDVQQHQVP